MKLRFRKQNPPEARRPLMPEGHAQIFSYHTRRSQELGTTGRKLFRDTPNRETASRAKRYWLQRCGLLVVILALCAVTVNVLLLSSDPSIMPVDPEQAYFLHDTITYRQAASELLRSSLLNSNKITVNTAAISASLKQEFPELSTVSVNLPLVGHRPIIYVAITKPALTLAGRFGRTYVVDEKGRALANASQTKGIHLSDLIQVKDDSGPPVRVGQLVISGDTVAFIQTIASQLYAKQLRASTFVLPAGRSEVDAYLAGQSYFVKFNLADPTPEQQVGTFFAVRQRLQGQGVTPAHYVDVRVAGRAYYQ